MKHLSVKVKPGSKRPGVSKLEDGTLEVRVKAPPVDGKANVEVLKALAQYLGLKRNQLEIKSGAASKLKRIQISE